MKAIQLSGIAVDKTVHNKSVFFLIFFMVFLFLLLFWGFFCFQRSATRKIIVWNT